MIKIIHHPFAVLAQTGGEKSADESWWDEDITINTESGYGAILILDYYTAQDSAVFYTLNGTTYQPLNGTDDSGYYYIRVYDNTRFNLKSDGIVNVHHCYVCER